MELVMVEIQEHISFEDFSKRYEDIASSAGRPSNAMVLAVDKDNPMVLIETTTTRPWIDLAEMEDPPKAKRGHPRKTTNLGMDSATKLRPLR